MLVGRHRQLPCTFLRPILYQATFQVETAMRYNTNAFRSGSKELVLCQRMRLGSNVLLMVRDFLVKYVYSSE